MYDPVIQALSGLADIQADRASGRPRMFRLKAHTFLDRERGVSRGLDVPELVFETTDG